MLVQKIFLDTGTKIDISIETTDFCFGKGYISISCIDRDICNLPLTSLLANSSTLKLLGYRCYQTQDSICLTQVPNARSQSTNPLI